MSTPARVRAFAPATVGNVAVGFDILGHAIEGVGDEVILERLAEPVIEIRSIQGIDAELPRDPRANTATAGLVALWEERSPRFGLAVHIHKGIPLSSGMGGSAASAAASVVAASAMLDEPLSDDELLRFGLLGEAVASGAAHADNLAPALFGGLRLVTRLHPPETAALPVPSDVLCVLVHPDFRVETRRARAALERAFEVGEFVEQSVRLSSFLRACFLDTPAALASCLEDVLVEPHRAALVPGFLQVKAAALDAGALGCSISGAGPSVFAWCRTQTEAEAILNAMMSAFEQEGLDTQGYISPVDAPGARILEASPDQEKA